MLKKHTQKKNKKQNQKQIKNSKLSLQLFLMANFDRVNGIRYESLEKTPILEYHKIGP
jgi:hypothetical protein